MPTSSNEKGPSALVKRLMNTALAVRPAAGTAGRAPAIEYPMENESVREGTYAIRISAEPGSSVDLSIDGGPWQHCRPAVGYWWYDWTPVASALCQIVARSRVGDGRWKKSGLRTCETVPAGQVWS